ncbi:MAG TPA: hypothetical protein VHL09_14025 [Dehalococcoidia bacterium]|nr:hypothetical protein [Dehalococcoidia bacterium]
MVNQQPWIVLLPVVLDLFFLFGPRVSIAPVVSQIVTMPFFAQSFGPDARGPAIAFAEEANLLVLLSPGGLTLPTIVPLLGIARGSYLMVDSAGSVVLLALGAILLGALLGCIYRSILAQQARDGELSAQRLPGESVVAWYRVIALALLLLVAGFLVILPLAFIAAVASLVTGAATAVMTAVVMTLALAAQLYLFFAPDAIFVSQVGPIQAIRRSAAVVHAGVWSALTLAILVTVIMVGMGQLWVMLASQASWGLAFGIVGNAYIASGLAAATMLFYRERMGSLLAQRS